MSLIYIKKFQIGGTGLHDISGRNKKTGMPLNSNFAVYTQAGNDDYSKLGSSAGNTNFMYTQRLKNPKTYSLDGTRVYGDVGLAVDTDNKLYGKLGLTVAADPRKNYESVLGLNNTFNKSGRQLNFHSYVGKKYNIGKYDSNLKGVSGTYLNVWTGKEDGLRSGGGSGGYYGKLTYGDKKSPFTINAYGNIGIGTGSGNNDVLKPFWNAGMSVTANLNALRKKPTPVIKNKPTPENNWVYPSYRF